MPDKTRKNSGGREIRLSMGIYQSQLEKVESGDPKSCLFQHCRSFPMKLTAHDDKVSYLNKLSTAKGYRFDLQITTVVLFNTFLFPLQRILFGYIRISDLNKEICSNFHRFPSQHLYSRGWYHSSSPSFSLTFYFFRDHSLTVSCVTII